MVEQTGKFVSPFTASDSVQQLNNADTQGIHFTMPDDDDFNPDSMLPELTKPTPDLDDSLCFDEGEEAQLPAFDELDIGVPSVSELHEDNSTTRTEPDKGSGEDLNDSLCGDNADEETQYHMDTANDIQPAAQSTPTPNLNDSMEMVGEDDALQATTHSPEASKLPPSQTKVLSGNKGAGDDDPNLDELFPETICDPQDCSQEGSKTGGTEGDSSKTNKTEGSNNKLEGCSDKLEKSSSPIQQSSKVVPSFGKKKKGFMPPTVKAPDPAISSSSATATKPAPKTKKSSSTNKTKGQDCEGAKLDEKSSVDKNQQNQKKEYCSGANKENSPNQDDTQEPKFSAPKLADTSVTTTDNKTGGTAEVPANVTKAEKTKATVKKPPQGKKENDVKKQEKEKKKLEKEQKKLEKEQKKLEQEQKKAEKERLKEEKRLEQERKKAEREQKKIEKDQKKLEREQKKAQKQQKPQKKKTPGKDSGAQASSNSEAQHSGSCEQNTVEKTSETNLMAASDNTEDKASAVSNCGGTNASESVDNSDKLLDTDSTSPSETTSAASTDVADTTPPSECKPNEDTATETSSSEKVQDNSDREMPETMKPRETNLSSPVETSAEDPGDSVATKQPDVSATTNSFNQTNSDGVSNEQLSEKSNMLQVTSGSDKENKNAPQKMATPLKDPQKQPISKAKKNQVNKSARKQESTNSQTQNKKKTKSAKTPNDKKVSSSAGSRKRKTVETQSTSESEFEPPEPKKPRSKPSNYYGPVWVQCEKPDCQKWRQLKDCLDPSEIPDKWTCSMNTESAYSTCLAPEEQWSEPEDSQEFVESPFVPGSIVWAKMDRYPWWPAMMEEDPDREVYYEMGEHRNVPVRYHVVFFDTPVCRAWVLAVSVQPFSEDSDANEAENVTVAQKYRRALRDSIKQAKKALKMAVAERLSQLTFAKRFCQTAGNRKRKYLMAGENVSDSTYHRSGAKPRAGSRKSSRLGTSKLTEEDASCDIKQVASANDNMHSRVSVGTIASSMEGGEENESLKMGSKEDSSNVLKEVEE